MTRVACDLFLPLAEEKEVRLISEIPEEAIALRADRQKLQRLLANLIDNAIKYTPAGGQVEVRLQKSGTKAEITVSDTGIGIAEENLPYIFKRFYRCDQSRSQPGTGLGLSLALAIAKVHGGGINVESRPGAGSTFSVCFPEAFG